MNYRAFLSGLIITAFAIFIFTFSLQDAPTSNALSTQVTQTIYKLIAPIIEDATHSIPSLNNLIRDLTHFFLFFLLGLISMLLFLYQQRTLKQSAWIILRLGVLVAIVDEVIQIFSPGRAFELIDLGKDILGILVSIVFVWVYVTIVKVIKH